MKKYMIYRAPGKVDRDIRQHELVGVEFGEDVFHVTDALIRSVCDDLSGQPENEKCEVYAFAPEEVPEDFHTKRYQYLMTGVISPPAAEKNTLIFYGITESASIPGSVQAG